MSGDPRQDTIDAIREITGGAAEEASANPDATGEAGKPLPELETVTWAHFYKSTVGPSWDADIVRIVRKDGKEIRSVVGRFIGLPPALGSPWLLMEEVRHRHGVGEYEIDIRNPHNKMRCLISAIIDDGVELERQRMLKKKKRLDRLEMFVKELNKLVRSNDTIDGKYVVSLLRML